jgi:VWFA-related protein
MQRVPAAALFVLTAFAFSACLLSAQDHTPPGTFRVRITEVPVDVIVLDKNNHSVLNLKKGDFQVFEDKIRQDIAHFLVESYVGGEPGSAKAKTAAPQAAGAAGSGFGNPNYRTFLIVVGQGWHRYFATIPKLIDFIRKGLGPSDRVGLMAFNRATDFTTEHGKLIEILERYEQISPSIETKIDLRTTGLAAVYGSRNILSGYQKEIDEIFGSEGVQSRRIASVNTKEREEQAARERRLMETKGQLDEAGRIAELRRRTESTPTVPASGGGAQQGGSAAPPSPVRLLSEAIETRLALDGMGFDEYVGLTTGGLMDREKLEAAIEYMRYMDGEKHIIFLSDQGLTLARLEDDHSLASLASDARVRVHTIQAGGTYLGGQDSVFSAASSSAGLVSGGGGGMTTSGPFPGTIYNAFALQSVTNLSRLTGGQALLHQDVAEALKTVEQTTAASYLLGYVPKNTSLDGGFRRIEVRVNRPGLRVMHRRGYYAERVLKPYDREKFLTYSRISAVVGLEELIHDVDFSLNTEKITPGASSVFQSSLTVRPAVSVYALNEGRYRGKLTIAYFLFDRGGTLLNETSDDLDMALLPETFGRVMKEGFTIKKTIQPPSDLKETILRIVIYDVANDRVGSAEAKLKVKN